MEYIWVSAVEHSHGKGGCKLRNGAHWHGVLKQKGVKRGLHIPGMCEALASLRHAYLGSFFLYPEDIRELGMGAIWNFAKGTGLL